MQKAILLLTVLLLSSCTNVGRIVPDENKAFQPTLAAETAISKTLQQVPLPAQPVTVSVYSFRDYTGQNKPGDIPQYSKAVTQGGLPLLKKALLDAGNQSWFRVLERGGLEDLLQERKIVRSIRDQYRTSDGKKLPGLGPLLYSGLLLEGGIIAYESNILTGGLGARYLGIGGSSEYRRDVVTVSLRAVSVTSGEVLLAVNTSKTILSTSVQGGMFKFVSFDKLLETEAGLTINEPPQLAVRQAIEMAVYSLIMEGANKDIWKFKNANEGLEALETYAKRVNKPFNPPVSLQKRAAHRTSKQKQLAKSSPRKNSQKSSSARKKTAKKKILQSNQVKKQKKVKAAAPSADSAKKIKTSVQRNDRHVSSVEETQPGWYFQVSAVKDFSDKELATIERFKSSGYPISVQMAEVKNQRYFRLLVGPYPSRAAASSHRIRVDHLSSKDEIPFLKKVGS